MWLQASASASRLRAQVCAEACQGQTSAQERRKQGRQYCCVRQHARRNFSALSLILGLSHTRRGIEAEEGLKRSCARRRQTQVCCPGVCYSNDGVYLVPAVRVRAGWMPQTWMLRTLLHPRACIDMRAHAHGHALHARAGGTPARLHTSLLKACKSGRQRMRGASPSCSTRPSLCSRNAAQPARGKKLSRN